jgi:hypothetical protein
MTQKLADTNETSGCLSMDSIRTSESMTVATQENARRIGYGSFIRNGDVVALGCQSQGAY